MRYHITLNRMVINKKSANDKCWRRCGEKGAILQHWWECNLVQPLWRTAWRFIKKLKIEVLYYLAIQLLDLYPENTVSPPHINLQVVSSKMQTCIVSIWEMWKCTLSIFYCWKSFISTISHLFFFPQSVTLLASSLDVSCCTILL